MREVWTAGGCTIMPGTGRTTRKRRVGIKADGQIILHSIISYPIPHEQGCHLTAKVPDHGYWFDNFAVKPRF